MERLTALLGEYKKIRADGFDGFVDKIAAEIAILGDHHWATVWDSLTVIHEDGGEARDRVFAHAVELGHISAAPAY